MTSDQILIKCGEKDISANLYQKCLIPCRKLGSITGIPQYEFTSFVAMATYWAPDLPNIKDISGHLQHPIFIFQIINGVPYA